MLCVGKGVAHCVIKKREKETHADDLVQNRKVCGRLLRLYIVLIIIVGLVLNDLLASSWTAVLTGKTKVTTGVNDLQNVAT